MCLIKIGLNYLLFFKPSPILSAARSTKGIVRLSPSERALIISPMEVKEILIGILLGDSHISRRSSTANSRLIYAQTAITYKECFDHVFNIFASFCVNAYISQSKIVRDNRTKKTYSAISLTTMQLPCFNVYKDYFYELNVKIVPNNIYELLTPRGLAFWIMDDGSKKGDGLHISVYAFSTTDVDKLMFTLQDKFNLKTFIHYNRDKKPRIYIFKESMDTLINLVKPYFIKEMLYKLGI